MRGGEKGAQTSSINISIRYDEFWRRPELFRIKGDLSDQFDVSKPTMSAHFAVLKEVDLVHAEKAGKSVLYHLKLSALEDALLGFVDSFGLGAEAPEPKAETAR